MKKNEIAKNVTSIGKKVTIKFKKHTPEILIATGIVSGIASTVFACKATTKVGKVIDDTKSDVQDVREALETGVTRANESYNLEDSKKDLAIIYVQTGVKIAKLYAPAAILGTISITSILASHNILRKRNAALAAAYATVDKTFKEYRSRVADRFGEEVEKELRYNIKAKKLEETVKDPETGKEKKVKSTVGVADPNTNEYSFWFDADTSKAYERNMDYNMMLLRAQQQFANDKLRADGFVFLSDVFDSIGVDRSKMSQIVGWVYNPDNPNGDNFVDFGIVETYREKEDGGFEKAILLNFNVDGPILDLI